MLIMKAVAGSLWPWGRGYYVEGVGVEQSAESTCNTSLQDTI